MVFNHFSKHPCVDCGETDPIVLTFDHVRGKKRVQRERSRWASIFNRKNQRGNHEV